MMQESVTAYKEFLDDPDMLAQNSGVLGNILQSCSRQITACYQNSGIPGTPYTGVDPFITSIPNTYRGAQQQRISVELSVVRSEFEWMNYNQYLVRPTIEAKFNLPSLGIGDSDELEMIDTELQFRDLRTRLAVVDGLYMALLVVPYYQGEENTGVPISAVEMGHGDPMIPAIACTYAIPTVVDLHPNKPAKLDILANMTDTTKETTEVNITIDPNKKMGRPHWERDKE